MIIEKFNKESSSIYSYINTSLNCGVLFFDAKLSINYTKGTVRIHKNELKCEEKYNDCYVIIPHKHKGILYTIIKNWKDLEFPHKGQHNDYILLDLKKFVSIDSLDYVKTSKFPEPLILSDTKAQNNLCKTLNTFEEIVEGFEEKIEKKIHKEEFDLVLEEELNIHDYAILIKDNFYYKTGDIVKLVNQSLDKKSFLATKNNLVEWIETDKLEKYDFIEEINSNYKQSHVEFIAEKITERLNSISNLYSTKSKEYSRGGAWDNFEKASKKSGKHKIDVLLDYKLKHEVSVDDLINDFKEGKEINSKQVDEKINDIILYYSLLAEMLKNN